MNNIIFRDPLLAFLTSEDLEKELLDCSSCLSDPALPSRAQAYNAALTEKIHRVLAEKGYSPESVSFVAGEENFCLNAKGQAAEWCDGHFSSHLAMCHTGEVDPDTLYRINTLSSALVDAGLPQTYMLTGTLENFIFQDNDV